VDNALVRSFNFLSTFSLHTTSNSLSILRCVTTLLIKQYFTYSYAIISNVRCSESFLWSFIN